MRVDPTEPPPERSMAGGVSMRVLSGGISPALCDGDRGSSIG